MRAIVAALGLLIGVLLGVALLLLNPLSFSQGTPAGLSGAVRVLGWESGGGFRGFELTPGGLLGWESAAGRAAAFGDPGLRHARVEIVALTEDAGGAQVLGQSLSQQSHDHHVNDPRSPASSCVHPCLGCERRYKVST